MPASKTFRRNKRELFMNPKIESFIEQLYEAFPTLMTPDFVETLERDLENKLLHEQISFLKEDVLPTLREIKSSITEVKSSFPDKNYEGNSEQNNEKLSLKETFEEDTSFEQENNELSTAVTFEEDTSFEQENNELSMVESFEKDKNFESETSEHLKQDSQVELDENMVMGETSKEDEKPEETDQTNKNNQEHLSLVGNELFTYLKEKLEDVSNINDLNKLKPEIKRLKNEEITKDSKALLCRKVGEIFLKHNCKKEALNSFKKALSYNPKVGVKRLYNKLKKELG